MKLKVKVAILVGMLTLNVIAGLYETGWLGSGLRQVKANDGPFPPPTWP